MKKRGNVDDDPIDQSSPDNSFNREALPPAPRPAYEGGIQLQASAAAAGVGSVTVTGWGDANMRRRLISSAFHQRNNPFRSNLATRLSGTKPSYNSRQPSLRFPK